MTSTKEIACRLKLRRPGRVKAPAPAARHAHIEGASAEQVPLADRVHRPLTTGRIDEDRLMPSVEKRTRDIHKKLDRIAAGGGWGRLREQCRLERPERQGTRPPQRRTEHPERSCTVTPRRTTLRAGAAARVRPAATRFARQPQGSTAPRQTGTLTNTQGARPVRACRSMDDQCGERQLRCTIQILGGTDHAAPAAHGNTRETAGRPPQGGEHRDIVRPA